MLVSSFDSGFDATGTYQLTVAHTSGPISVAEGDERRRSLTNGGVASGAITRGDLDVLDDLRCCLSERISVDIAETSDTADFRPWRIRLWAPNGAVLGDTAGLAAATITTALAPLTGTYLVLVSSFDSRFGGTGTYQLVVSR